MKHIYSCLSTITLAILLLCSCKDKQPDFVKPVALQGNAEPVVHGGWRKMGDFFNENATVAYLFALNGKAYFRVTMLYQTPESNFWEYDPALNRFTKRAMLPDDYSNTAHNYFGCLTMSINNTGYLGLGYWIVDGTVGLSNHVWAYNPASDQWTRKADFPVSDASFPGRFVIGDKGYVLGYQDSNGRRRNADLYAYSQLSDTWQKLGSNYPLSAAATSTFQFGLAGKGYLLGGNTVNNKINVAEYDPSQNTFGFPTKADFPREYLPTAAYIQDDKVYAYGDKPQNSPSAVNNEIWRYDPLADKWERQTDFSGPARYLPSTFAIGDKAYIGFGYSGGTDYVDIWEYNP